MKPLRYLLIVCFLIAFNTRADTQVCPPSKNIIAQAWDKLVALVRRTPPTDAEVKAARIKRAREKLLAGTGLDAEFLGDPMVGGMSTTFPGKGQGAFHKHPAIPEELYGRPVEDFMIKVTHKDISRERILRDEEAYEEIQNGLRPGSRVKLMETYTVTLEDGTRIVYQRKAPGVKPTDLIHDMFRSVFAEEPDKYGLEMLLTKLNDTSFAPCFGPAQPGPKFEYLCGELLDHGIDGEKVGVLLKQKKYQNLVKTLGELKNISLGEGLPRTTAHSLKLQLGNVPFWSGRMSSMAVDLSIDNFNLELRGDEVLAHIFDY